MSLSVEHYEWRYAVKKFDASKKISDEQLKHLLETLRLAPSSFGLQPWKFLVINDPETRKELQPYAWNQPQTTEASHLIVLCGKLQITENEIKNFVHQTARERNVPEESLKGYQDMMIGFVKRQTPEQHTAWIDRQIYIALGVLMAECAHLHIDSCPMEGFSAADFDRVLKLKDQGLRTVVLCPVGYRATDDKYAALKKIRYSAQEVISYR